MSVLTMALGVLCLILLLVGGVLLKNSKESSNNELPNLQKKYSTDFMNFSEDSTIRICPRCGKECQWCGKIEVVEDSVETQIDSLENELKLDNSSEMTKVITEDVVSAE